MLTSFQIYYLQYSQSTIALLTLNYKLRGESLGHSDCDNSELLVVPTLLPHLRTSVVLLRLSVIIKTQYMYGTIYSSTLYFIYDPLTYPHSTHSNTHGNKGQITHICKILMPLPHTHTSMMMMVHPPIHIQY